jgi:hypothetical protein
MPDESDNDNGKDKAFFNNIVRALTGVCAAKTKTGTELPLSMSAYDVVFAVLGSQELRERQHEIMESPEFPKMHNEFVRGIKQGVVGVGVGKNKK